MNKDSLNNYSNNEHLEAFTDIQCPFKPGKLVKLKITSEKQLDEALEHYWEDIICSQLQNMEDDLSQLDEESFKSFVDEYMNNVQSVISLSDDQLEHLHQRIYFKFSEYDVEYVKYLRRKYFIDAYDETFYWGDFFHKWNRRTITNIFPFIMDLMCVYGYVISGKGKSIQKVSKENSISMFRGKPNSDDFCIFLGDLTMTIDNLITSPYGQFITYNAIVFRPYSELSPKLTDNNYNLFSGFKAKRIDNVSMDVINPVLKHIESVWAGDNKEWYHWILSYFSWILKYPHIKTQKVLTLSSDQGAGKNIITDWIEEYIIGLRHAVTIAGTEKLTQRFNSVIESKLLITCNEVDTAENYKAAFNKLKTLITEKRQAIERKGCDIDYVNDCCNYVILSNNDFCVYLEESDRRYAIPDVSNKYSGDYAYFKNLSKHLTDDTANHLYTYLLNYDGLDVRDKNTIPVSKAKESIIELSLPASKSFIKNMLSGEYNIHDEIIKYNAIRDTYSHVEYIKDKHDKDFIKKDDLYKLFVEWCKSQGKHACCSRKFFIEIKMLINLDERPYMSDGSRLRAISLPSYPKTIKESTNDIYNI